MILLANSEGTDQTMQMHRLIWAFTVHFSRRHIFAWCGPNVRKKFLFIREKLGKCQGFQNSSSVGTPLECKMIPVKW